MRDGRRGLIETLLRIPLFAKILLTNGAILAVMVGGSLLLVRANPGLADAPAFLLIGRSTVTALVTGAAVNAILVRLALSPVRELEATARDVERGDRQARASESVLADANLLRLTRVFNRMLDRLEHERSRRRQVAVRASAPRTRRDDAWRRPSTTTRRSVWRPTSFV